jgi:hypothetical protein
MSVIDSLRQNREQGAAQHSACDAQGDPKETRFKLEPFVIGFEFVDELIALPACRRLPIVGSVLPSFHASLCLDNPGGKVALYMPRLSKRWQFSERPSLDDHV